MMAVLGSGRAERTGLSYCEALMPPIEYVTKALPWVIGLLVLLKAIWDLWAENQASKDVHAAEERAFTPTDDLRGTAAGEAATAAPPQVPEVNRLCNLYNKQIEKYQNATRARATWSFIFAIAAMASGFGFVIWGGTT